MANGDAAAAAGLLTVPPSGPNGKARDGYSWINYVLDRVVSWVIGTAQLADAAVTTVKLANGAVTPAKFSGTLPVANGGTGATDAAAARAALGAQAALGFTPVRNNGGNQIILQRRGTDLAVEMLIDATGLGSIVTADWPNGNIYMGAGKINSSGSRNFPVSVNYAAAYFDGNNWLGITPSARRFKQDIHPAAYTLDQLMAIQLVAYRLRDAVAEDPEAAGEVGVIAEQLVDAGLGEFVIRDPEGQPQSVAYERLWLVLLSGTQHLVTMVRDMSADLDALTGRVATLEGTP